MEESAPEENMLYDKEIECKNCNIEEGQVKVGKTAAGSQRNKCKKCGKVYTPKPKGREHYTVL